MVVPGEPEGGFLRGGRTEEEEGGRDRSKRLVRQGNSFNNTCALTTGILIVSETNISSFVELLGWFLSKNSRTRVAFINPANRDVSH